MTPPVFLIPFFFAIEKKGQTVYAAPAELTDIFAPF